MLIAAARNQWQQQLAALMAVDVDNSFHAAGQIVLIARVGNKDVVRIIPIRRDATLSEYRETVLRLQEQFGVINTRIDGNHMVLAEWDDRDRAEGRPRRG